MDATPEPVDPDRDETTLADEEWPVAEFYRVEPAAPVAAVDGPAGSEHATVVAPVPVAPTGGTSGARRFPPDLGPGALVALIAVALLIAAAAAVWLVSTADDDASATRQSTDTGPAIEQPLPPPTTPTPLPSSTSGKTVPEVIGMTLDKARPLLRDAGQRVLVKGVVSEDAPGAVLLQSPSAGQKPSANNVVVLTVAREPEQVVVPRVIGLPASEATDALRDAGLNPEIRAVRSTEDAGTVIDQTPAPDVDVDRDTVVRIEIATPPTPTQSTPTPAPRVEIPRLLGLMSADARSDLRELGLRSTVTLVESPQPDGTVIGQSPRAGAAIEKGGTVTLRVSRGPASVAVPDVVGVDEQTARQQLEDAGFVVETVDEPTSDPSEDGIVVDQTPSAGAHRPTGTVVTLRVARSG